MSTVATAGRAGEAGTGDRVQALDWTDVNTNLDAYGWALIEGSSY